MSPTLEGILLVIGGFLLLVLAKYLINLTKSYSSAKELSVNRSSGIFVEHGMVFDREKEEFVPQQRPSTEAIR